MYVRGGENTIAPRSPSPALVVFFVALCAVCVYALRPSFCIHTPRGLYQLSFPLSLSFMNTSIDRSFRREKKYDSERVKKKEEARRSKMYIELEMYRERRERENGFGNQCRP